MLHNFFKFRVGFVAGHHIDGMNRTWIEQNRNMRVPVHRQYPQGLHRLHGHHDISAASRNQWAALLLLTNADVAHNRSTPLGGPVCLADGHIESFSYKSLTDQL